MAGGARRDILCVWATRWDGLWQRHQQLMSRLAATRRVLYVESPRDLWSLGRSILRRQVRISQLFGTRRVTPNIRLFSPVTPFSLRRYPRLNRLYLALLAPYLRLLTRLLGMPTPILWICYPQAGHLVTRLPSALACYDCCDDLTDVAPPMARIIRDEEARLLKNVRCVFATSEPLLHRLSASHPDVHLVPNGADYAHFSTAHFASLPAPLDLTPMPRPIVGFIGSVQHWVDVDLIAAAATLRPDWSWVIVGGLHTDVQAVRKLANVHLLGEKPYADLPRYLRRFDVCVVPFRQTPITHAADPIKFYEYLSAGKPVVSTPMPRTEAFGRHVRVSQTPEGFVKHVETVLQEETEERAAPRMALAKRYSWDSRVAQIIAVWDAASEETSPSVRR